MKAKISAALVAMLLALGLAVGCAKSGSNDAQIIGQVATKVQADSAVQTKAIAIQSNNGVVTLSGQVGSDAERNAIAADAGQVEGVKTVVNNLTVASAAVTPAPAVEPPAEQAKPEPVKSSARHHEESSRRKHDYANNTPPPPPPANTVAQVTPPPTPVVQAPVAPPPPPKPVTVTIPEGTQIAIRLVDPLDSEKNQVGDRFRATIAHTLRIDDQVVIPVGTDVEGRVVDVKDAGHFSGHSVLAVELTNLSMGGKNYELHTEQLSREGAGRGKNTAEKVGGGAAVGAILGGIIGGGKGAAIGSVVGAGGGGGVQAATKGQQVRLPVESALNFQLASPLTVTPVKQTEHGSGDRPVLTDRAKNNNGTSADNDNNNNNYSDNTTPNDQDSTDRPVLQRRPPSNGNDNDNDNNSNNNNPPN